MGGVGQNERPLLSSVSSPSVRATEEIFITVSFGVVVGVSAIEVVLCFLCFLFRLRLQCASVRLEWRQFYVAFSQQAHVEVVLLIVL